MATPAGMPPREAADEASPQPGQLPSALRDERAKVIYTNQFGTPCNRFLLVYDDLLDKGMGWLARYWSLALIAGVQAGRVLHEVAPPAGPTHWCAVPPFTLECYMARWNDCEVQSMPTASGIPTLHRRASQGTWGVEGLTRSKYLNRTALHMPLSAFAPVRWPSVHRPGRARGLRTRPFLSCSTMLLASSSAREPGCASAPTAFSHQTHYQVVRLLRQESRHSPPSSFVIASRSAKSCMRMAMAYQVLSSLRRLPCR